MLIRYTDYMGYDVEVIDKYNNVFKGPLISYQHGYDQEPELSYDIIGVQTKKSSYTAIPIPDIKEFKVLDENIKEILIKL